MWIQKPQRINEHIEYLGSSDMSLYLIKGQEYMLVEGAMSYIVPAIIKQLEEREIERNKITRYLILHSHFDHCGAVPFFKRMLPAMQVVGSYRAKEIYQKEKAIKFIREVNALTIERLGMQKQAKEMNLDFDTLSIDEAVKEGDLIDLGEGVQVKIIDTPGHSSCSITAYLPSDKAMFPSDAGGIPNEKNEIFPAGNEDYILYQQTLKKLAQYPVEIMGLARCGVFSGEDASNYLARSLEASENFRLKIIDLMKEDDDLETGTREIGEYMYQRSSIKDIPHDVFLGLIRSMVKRVWQDYQDHNP